MQTNPHIAPLPGAPWPHNLEGQLWAAASAWRCSSPKLSVEWHLSSGCLQGWLLDHHTASSAAEDWAPLTPEAVVWIVHWSASNPRGLQQHHLQVGFKLVKESTGNGNQALVWLWFWKHRNPNEIWSIMTKYCFILHIFTDRLQYQEDHQRSRRRRPVHLLPLLPWMNPWLWPGFGDGQTARNIVSSHHQPDDTFWGLHKEHWKKRLWNI